jgi:hypothetical protein
MNIQELEKRREDLRNSLKGDFMHDLSLREEIHKLTMLIEGVKPNDGSCDLDCDSCGA